MCMQVLQRPEEGVRSPGAGATEGCGGGGGQGKNAHDRRTSQVRLCQAHGTETGGHCHRKRLKTVLVVTDFVFNLLI